MYSLQNAILRLSLNLVVQIWFAFSLCKEENFVLLTLQHCLIFREFGSTCSANYIIQCFFFFFCCISLSIPTSAKVLLSKFEPKNLTTFPFYDMWNVPINFIIQIKICILLAGTFCLMPSSYCTPCQIGINKRYQQTTGFIQSLINITVILMISIIVAQKFCLR